MAASVLPDPVEPEAASEAGFGAGAAGFGAATAAPWPTRLR